MPCRHQSHDSIVVLSTPLLRAGMRSLWSLALNNCSFSGPWPQLWGQLPLGQLWVNSNKFNGMPVVIGNVEHVQVPSSLHAGAAARGLLTCQQRRRSTCTGELSHAAGPLPSHLQGSNLSMLDMSNNKFTVRSGTKLSLLGGKTNIKVWPIGLSSQRCAC